MVDELYQPWGICSCDISKDTNIEATISQKYSVFAAIFLFKKPALRRKLNLRRFFATGPTGRGKHGSLLTVQIN